MFLIDIFQKMDESFVEKQNNRIWKTLNSDVVILNKQC